VADAAEITAVFLAAPTADATTDVKALSGSSCFSAAAVTATALDADANSYSNSSYHV